MMIIVVIKIPIVSRYISEILQHIARKPAMNHRRDVDDTTLNARLCRRFNHLLQQQFRQQKMAEIISGERHLHAVFGDGVLMRVFPGIVTDPHQNQNLEENFSGWILYYRIEFG